MKKKLFVRFFALTFISAVLVFAVGLVAVNLSAKNLIRKRLEAETGLACALLSEESDYENFKIYFNNDEFRVTVFDLEGNVKYESDTQAPLPSHDDRKEFKMALEGKSEAIERFSETFKCRMTYYALKTKLSNGEEIVVRLAVKNSQVSEYVSVALPLLLIVLVISFVISLTFANYQSKAVAKEINQVGESLKNINEGKYIPIISDASDDELSAVYDQVNDLAKSAYEHVLSEERERKKLDSVLSNVAQGIIAIEKNNGVVFANKSAKSLFSATEVEGRGLISLLGDENLYSKIIERKDESFSFEYTRGEKILSVSVTKITDESLVADISSIIIITDITAIKTVEMQKSDFFANASHELKTPVTVMQGLSEILLSKELDEQSKKQVDRIYKESARLASLISDMLKLSKLERGEEDVTAFTEVDLIQVAEEVKGELQSKIEGKAISFTLNGGGVVIADYKKIYEVVENLVSNAVNYNKEGGKVDVLVEDGEKEVKLTVSDTGIGIENEHLPRLCERFYRVDKSRSKKTGGTGLGLAIVKHVCALYGAELHIESEPGIGTKVEVVFKKQ